MAYTIELSFRAYADIEHIVEHIQADSPQNATRWRTRLFEKIETLHLLPHGCALAPEDEFCPFEVRQTLLGEYRILFSILENLSMVYVLTVRHGARRTMPPDTLRDSAGDVLDPDSNLSADQL